MEKKTIGIILFILLLIIVVLKDVLYKTAPLEIDIIIWILSFMVFLIIFYYMRKSGIFTATNTDVKIMFVMGAILITVSILLLLTNGLNKIESVLFSFIIGMIFILAAYSIKKRYSL